MRDFPSIMPVKLATIIKIVISGKNIIQKISIFDLFFIKPPFGSII
jgi:hypothetical protein